LRGRVAFVTGGRGGIGRAICERFLREGAYVFAGDLTEQGSLPKEADGSHFVRLDVSSEEEVRVAMDLVGRRFDKLDVLVNAAGVEIEKTIEQTSLADWNRIFAVSVTGTFPPLQPRLF
jgi:meso-butanediol dehydrogenase/(S,S)-butanediol dehydrogenase/diacetyl reductase